MNTVNYANDGYSWLAFHLPLHTVKEWWPVPYDGQLGTSQQATNDFQGERKMSAQVRCLSLCYQWAPGHTNERTPGTRKGRVTIHV